MAYTVSWSTQLPDWTMTSVLMLAMPQRDGRDRVTLKVTANKFKKY